MTTEPSIAIASKAFRIASIAAMSAAVSSPRPMKRAEASAAASVTRTSSIARLRSIANPSGSAPEQAVEQRVRLGNEDALLARVALVVAPRRTARLLLVGGDVHDERDGIVGVRLQRARRRMVGQHEDAPLAARLPQPVEQRPDDLLVEVLDRLDLLLRVAEVTTLVGRLDVQEEEV